MGNISLKRFDVSRLKQPGLALIIGNPSTTVRDLVSNLNVPRLLLLADLDPEECCADLVHVCKNIDEAFRLASSKTGSATVVVEKPRAHADDLKVMQLTKKIQGQARVIVSLGDVVDVSPISFNRADLIIISGPVQRDALFSRVKDLFPDRETFDEILDRHTMNNMSVIMDMKGPLKMDNVSWHEARV